MQEASVPGNRQAHFKADRVRVAIFPSSLIERPGQEAVRRLRAFSGDELHRRDLKAILAERRGIDCGTLGCLCETFTDELAMGAYTAFLDLAQGLASPVLGLIATGARLNVVFLASSFTVLCAAFIASWLIAHPTPIEGCPQ